MPNYCFLHSVVWVYVRLHRLETQTGIINFIKSVCVSSLWSLMDNQTTECRKLLFSTKDHFSIYIIPTLSWIFSDVKIGLKNIRQGVETKYSNLIFFLWLALTSASKNINFCVPLKPFPNSKMCFVFVQSNYLILEWNLILWDS